MERIGLGNIANSFSLSLEPDSLRGPRGLGELIASRYPLAAVPYGFFDVPWPEKILSAEIDLVGRKLELHTVHIPPGSSNKWIKIETLEGLYRGLAHDCGHPRLLCGDFNMPQWELPDGTVVTWGQRLGKDGRVITRRNFRGGSGERWDAGERNVLRGLAEFGLRDVYREMNRYGGEADYSWVLSRKGMTRNRRFDHVFASPALKPIACRYLHEARERGLSDHSPILAEFEVQE
ncbi:MAG: endonuclease/exonuclease/phosphatase family protein [Gemmatimonadota bacterium]